MNRNYLIIGNPVEHSLSPKIHNFWFNKNNINATYKKETLLESKLENLVKRIKEGDISGANVTVPFKQKIIPFLDELSDLAKKTQSVNTLYKEDDLVIGDNTDVYGFSQSILNQNISLKNKDALIVGAGGVVPSVITALEDLSIRKIYIKNRTQEKLYKLKEIFTNINPLEWDQEIDCNIVINATSLGLKPNDQINLNFDNLKNKTIFYDTIYNPPVTNFLKNAKEKGHDIINGKLMLLLQAQKAFEIWTGINPKIDEKFLNYLND
ncbi:shikimate dehydrogenase [Candidatus Pelagibacter sp.]|uniref:shikimate dehydrogenase n=1 Tax=Candidatus Pelagibacter sp. TaxID=2024849 RepID=UPI003F82AE28